MLKRVTLEGITLPRLYIAENNEDVKIAMENGFPFVRWRQGTEALIKMLLRPTLEKMFPGIIWNKVLGKKKNYRTEVVQVEGRTLEDDVDFTGFDNEAMVEAQHRYDKGEAISKYNHVYDGTEEPVFEVAEVAEAKREFTGVVSNEASFEKRTAIEDYVGDLSTCVNLDVLQKLNLLPSFLGDIVDCIKVNLANNMRWTEGYNKKLGVPLGRFGVGGVLPNLIILDVSGSIPRGISATMLTLIDTMRAQLNAELIITANRSVYYDRETELPTPQALRNYFGYGNEAAEFYAILNQYVAGREFGHVISFGDYDSPVNFGVRRNGLKLELKGTKVHAVHHYHTGASSWRNGSTAYRTGYAGWCHKLGDKSMAEFKDQSWCSIMKKDW